MKNTTYSVKQVSELSGVSIRTLHYYEDIGLLCPKRLANGYHSYSSKDIARLQQILLFKTCGMELNAIKTLLEQPDYRPIEALRQQLEILDRQKEQLDAVICTVKTTILSLEGVTTMTDKQKFEGLKKATIDANEAQYGAEARALYGDAAVDNANAKLMAMQESDWNTMNNLEQAIIEQLSKALISKDPTGPDARELARLHADWIRMHWGEGAYSKEAHRSLAQGYLADKRFVEYYDSRAGAGATQFLAEAITNNI